MYYKVIKNNKVIDVLDNLIYLKWEPKHKIMVLSDIDEAQAILASDKNTIWHEQTLYKVPTNEVEFDTVEVLPIDQFEYKRLRTLNLLTPEQIVDSVIFELISEGVI